jgi:hypothetical protein
MTSEPNMLKNRDRHNIDAIESSFKTGLLHQAMQEAPEIERRRGLSVEEFTREYRKSLRPVVIEGLMDSWPAVKNWNFTYLADKCGEAKVVVDSYDSKKAREVTFREFTEMLKVARQASRSPVYLQEWLYMAECPQLAADLPELEIAQYDFRRNLFGERISTNHQLWIGQQGATTRLHQDSYSIDVMHAQIVGNKHWCVLGPDAALGRNQDGELDFAALLDHPTREMRCCVLNPGEVVYLPARWYHRIELLTDSIGQGRKCLDEVNLQTYTRLRFAELLCLALNHDYIKEAFPELYKVVVLRNQAVAKLMDIDLRNLRP